MSLKEDRVGTVQMAYLFRRNLRLLGGATASVSLDIVIRKINIM